MASQKSTVLIGRPDLTESNAHAVLRNAWFEYAHEDTEFELVQAVRGRNPRTGVTFVVEWPGTAIWTAHPNAGMGEQPRFTLLEFAIEVIGADEFTLAKARQVADAISGTIKIL